MPLNKPEPPLAAGEVLLNDDILAVASQYVEQALGNLPGAWADPLYAGNTSTVIRNCKFVFYLAAVQDALEEQGVLVTISLQHGSGGVFVLPLIAKVRGVSPEDAVTLTFLHMDLWPVALAAKTIIRRLKI